MIDNVEDLDAVMRVYNLIKCSKNYSKTSVTSSNYWIDVSIDPITNSESYKYKTSIKVKTAHDGNTKEVESSVLLKHLINFWITLDMSLINCEVSFTFTWYKIVFWQLWQQDMHKETIQQ